MKPNDWVKDAATEINLTPVADGEQEKDILLIQSIIEKHCPFKKGVVYEEVTETSRKLDELMKMVKEHDEMLKYIRRSVY